jgi:hypothetical protein
MDVSSLAAASCDTNTVPASFLVADVLVVVVVDVGVEDVSWLIEPPEVQAVGSSIKPTAMAGARPSRDRTLLTPTKFDPTSLIGSLHA